MWYKDNDKTAKKITNKGERWCGTTICKKKDKKDVGLIGHFQWTVIWYKICTQKKGKEDVDLIGQFATIKESKQWLLRMVLTSVCDVKIGGWTKMYITLSLHLTFWVYQHKEHLLRMWLWLVAMLTAIEKWVQNLIDMKMDLFTLQYPLLSLLVPHRSINLKMTVVKRWMECSH